MKIPARLSEPETVVTPPEMVDVHTHMIPGVDDGAPDLESALQTLEDFFHDGVTAVAATPHLNASDPNGSRRERADSAWPELLENVQARLTGLQLYRGYEIQLDVPDLDLSDPGLRIAGSRFALVEFFAFTIPEHSADALARIVADGYVPILVHPERYWGYDHSMAVVADWRSAGALIQLNGGSLLGEYGAQVRAIAHRFLRDGAVDLIASDNHARPSRNPSLRPVWEYLAGHGFAEQASLLMSTNPGRILRDEVPQSVGRLQTRSWLTRLARAFRAG